MCTKHSDEASLGDVEIILLEATSGAEEATPFFGIADVIAKLQIVDNIFAWLFVVLDFANHHLDDGSEIGARGASGRGVNSL